MLQVALRVKNETDKTRNSDANNSNNDSVTSYSASITSYIFLCSLLSSLFDPQQHEIERSDKECIVEEVNISYKYQFILNSAATKHLSEILKIFTSIKYSPKNCKGPVILGDGVTKLKVQGIRNIAD